VRHFRRPAVHFYGPRELRRESEGDRRFGGCPECGRTDGYMNVGGSHWFVCDAHLTKWCAGYDLFSDWNGESPEVWERNKWKLEGYTEVQPVH
jgi:hypothetical protein